MSEFRKKEVEEKVEIQSTQDQINEFGREQIIYVCQYCQKKILTEIEHQTTWIGIALSLILFIIFRIYSIPLIIMLIPLTQQTVHSCPNCLNKIGTRSFYDLISLSDNVITYKFGNFGIIITKKQILAVFTFLLFGLIFYLFFSSLDITRGNFIKESWSDFKNECQNGETDLNCSMKYKYSDVNWNGYVIRIDYNDNFFARYRLSVLIKMDKNQEEDPDLYLKFTDFQYDIYKTDIFNITRGDLVSFNATILHAGEKVAMPTLELFGFRKLNDHIYIQPHIHHNSRYSVDHAQPIHKDDAVYKELPGLISNDEIKIDQHETYH